MCNNFLQQMEIDALEQLISEDVKVQGQILCVMVSKLASWSSESSPELLPESSPEEMRSTSTTLLPGSSLEESALTSMHMYRFFLRVEEKNMPLHGGHRWSPPTWPLRGVWLPPRADEEPTSFMERRGRRTGVARWDDSSSSPRNLTLLAGAADSTEEDGRGHGRGASSLQNLSLESRAIPAMETRLRRRRGRRKPEKMIEGRRQGRAFIKKVRCANDTMINKHPSPMKGRGEVCSNEEQFGFPRLLYIQILYHVFLCQL
jgi:hypothetical protein